MLLTHIATAQLSWSLRHVCRGSWVHVNVILNRWSYHFAPPSAMLSLGGTPLWCSATLDRRWISHRIVFHCWLSWEMLVTGSTDWSDLQTVWLTTNVTMFRLFHHKPQAKVEPPRLDLPERRQPAKQTRAKGQGGFELMFYFCQAAEDLWKGKEWID